MQSLGITNLLTLAMLTVSYELKASPNSPIHGPESYAPLDLSKSYRIDLLSGQPVSMNFYSSAHYENEVNVYDNHGNRVARRGNKQFGLKPFFYRNQSNVTDHHHFLVEETRRERSTSSLAAKLAKSVQARISVRRNRGCRLRGKC